jgi:hypothetical protein
MNVLNLAVHLVRPFGGGSGQGVQECRYGGHVLVGPSKGRAWRPLVVDGGGDSLGPSLSLGEVDCCGLLRLERSLAVV